MKKGFSFIDKKPMNIKDDILSGLTVALALVPEAVAFAFVAGISPIVGLYGAFMMGLISSVFGGRPGMISGATGAMAVVMVGLIKEGVLYGGGNEAMGLQFLFVTLLLVGVIQASVGFFKLGKFIRLIPHPVMMGFVNGLAIVIFFAQLDMFKSDGSWLRGQPLWTMLGLVVLTMGILYLFPKLTKKVPAALVGILTVTLIVIFADLDTQTVKTFIQAGGGEGIKAGLPTFNIPMIPINLETITIILPYAVILAAIGLIESLMTLTLVDELTETRGSGNREAMAQGLGNFINGLFGGMGGCAMIGQSIINIKSGGRGRLSGISAAIALLMFVLFTSSYIEMIPIAALVGVMFTVVIGTFAWSTFKTINKIPVSDAIVIVLVTTLTVIFDLAIAVLAGVVVSALVFAWNSATRIRARKTVDERGIKHYEIYGPLFFGSTKMFEDKFDVANDPDEVIISFKESRVMDQSAIESINKVTERYFKAGKTILLRHLSGDCIALLEKAEKICDVNILHDPEYHVAVDNFASKAKKK
ncbi:MAG: SulP family inorganic anion transporter [Marinifilaceae bacterium]